MNWKICVVFCVTLICMGLHATDVIIGTSSFLITYPFSHRYGYVRSAALYKETELVYRGPIRSLSWFIGTTNSTRQLPIKIYLKTTDALNVSSPQNWSNYTNGATLVYEGTISFSSTGWKQFNIQEYDYQGGNLLVLCESNYGNYGWSINYINFTSTGAQSMHAYTYQQVTPPSGNLVSLSQRPNIKFEFPDYTPLPASLIYPLDNAVDVYKFNTLKWEAAAGFPDGYKLYLGTNNPPDNIINGLDIGAQLEYTSVFDDSTTYFWRIVPYNENGECPNPPIWSFTTLADYSISSFPYFEGFSSNIFPPLGWTMFDNDNDGFCWGSGDGSAGTLFNYNADDYLVTPPIALSGGQELQFMAKSSLLFPTYLKVLLSTTTPYPESFTTTLLPMIQPHDHLRKITLDLRGYIGQCYIAFINTNPFGEYLAGINIDDILIRNVPTSPIFCINPDTTIWDFGEQIIQQCSNKEFAVSNTGHGNLIINSISINSNQFTLTQQPSSLILGDEETVKFTIQYHPVSVGSHEAICTISTNITTLDFILVGKCLPPGVCIDFDPPNLAVNVMRNKILTWNKGDGLSPIIYKLYLGTDNPPTNIKNGVELATNFAAPHWPAYVNDCLYDANTTYYWQIIPQNPNGQAVNCPILSFSTGNSFLYPESFATQTAGSDIGQFTIGEYSNPINSPTQFINNPNANGSYNAYTDQVQFSLHQGANYQVLITEISSVNLATSGIGLFIDLNHNGNFDMEEYLFQGLLNIQDTTIIGSVYIPSYCTLGLTLMRVVLIEGNLLRVHPFYEYNRGETEDYLVEILPPETGIPDNVTLIYPNDQYTLINPVGLNISWNNSQYGGMQEGYWVYISTSIDEIFAQQCFTINHVPVNNFELSKVFMCNYNQQYYWTVLPYNNFGTADSNSPSFQIFSFSTIPDPALPLPYRCGFETGMPENWTTEAIDTYRNWSLWDIGYVSIDGTNPLSSFGSIRLYSPRLNTSAFTHITIALNHSISFNDTGIIAKIQISHDLIEWTDTGLSFDYVSENLQNKLVGTYTTTSSSGIYIGFYLEGEFRYLNNWTLDEVIVSTENIVTLKSFEFADFVTPGNFFPAVKFINFGPDNANCAISMNIDNSYRSIRQLDNIAPCQEIVVAFDVFLPEELNNYQVSVVLHDSNNYTTIIDSLFKEFICAEITGFGFATVVSTDVELNQHFNEPVRLSLNEPLTLTPVCSSFSTNQCHISGGDWINGNWYGIENCEGTGTNPKVWKLDVNNGNLSIVSTLQTNVDITGFAYDNNNDIVYLSSINSLYTANLTTGLVTQIGFYDTDVFMICIAYDDRQNSLYGFDLHNDALYTINSQSAHVNMVGYLGIPLNFAQDCAFDRNTGNLFLAYYPELFSGSPGLYWVNTTNGGAFLVDSFPDFQELTGFAIPYTSNTIIELSISANVSSISLNWNTINNAIGYNIYRSENPQSGFQLISTTSNTYWTQQQQQDPKFFYRVTAKFNENRNIQKPLSELIKTKPKHSTHSMKINNNISNLNVPKVYQNNDCKGWQKD